MRTVVTMMIAWAVSAAVALMQAAPARVVATEFIYDRAPFPSAHASTIVETQSALVAAWFGGSRESAPDVGIWVSRQVKKIGRPMWTAPVEVAAGTDAKGARVPCWNPVLFVDGGRVLLFYKVGPNPREWWGMMRTSTDEGQTWSEATRLPDGVLGPIKNKPIALADGTWLSPSSTEAVGDGSGPWRVHFERSTDKGRTWSIVTPPPGMPALDSIQPTLLQHPNGKLQAIGRTRNQKLFTTWSSDAGKSWTPLELMDVPNPNAGVDAVTLKDGRHLLVHNPSASARTPLSVAISNDGVTWTRILDLETETGEYSYPAVIQSRDGHVHITYTWKREKIKYVEIETR